MCCYLSYTAFNGGFVLWCKNPGWHYDCSVMIGHFLVGTVGYWVFMFPVGDNASLKIVWNQNSGASSQKFKHTGMSFYP
ncbi:MAG: hypothetical protein IJU00_15315 [Selenomonas sp.]|nr:hypothetical protein [Selenomonas sp.]